MKPDTWIQKRWLHYHRPIMLLFREILWKSLLEAMVFTGGEFIARLTLVFLVQHRSSSVWPNYPVLSGRFAIFFLNWIIWIKAVVTGHQWHEAFNNNDQKKFASKSENLCSGKGRSYSQTRFPQLATLQARSRINRFEQNFLPYWRHTSF